MLLRLDNLSINCFGNQDGQVKHMDQYIQTFDFQSSDKLETSFISMSQICPYMLHKIHSMFCIFHKKIPNTHVWRSEVCMLDHEALDNTILCNGGLEFLDKYSKGSYQNNKWWIRFGKNSRGWVQRPKEKWQRQRRPYLRGDSTCNTLIIGIYTPCREWWSYQLNW